MIQSSRAIVRTVGECKGKQKSLILTGRYCKAQEQQRSLDPQEVPGGKRNWLWTLGRCGKPVSRWRRVLSGGER